MPNQIGFIISIFSIALLAGCISQQYTSNDSTTNSTMEIVKTTTSIKDIAKTTTTKEPFIIFKFVENITGCPMDGNVIINNINTGISYSGVMNLNYQKLSAADKGSKNEICIDAVLNCKEMKGWKTKRCWEISLGINNINDYNGEEVIFSPNISIHRPLVYTEMENFVSPSSVSYFIDHQSSIGFFSNDVPGDVDKIWNYMSNHFSYRYDSDTTGMDYWKSPNETLLQEWGDCEDFSNLFISLARAYNNSLKCYSILLPDHLGTFCKIPSFNSDSYGFYDNMNAPIKTFVLSGGNGTAKLNEAMITYFVQYGIDEENHKITAAFDEKSYYTFETNDEFVNWARNL